MRKFQEPNSKFSAKGGFASGEQSDPRMTSSRLLRRALPTACGLAFLLFTFYFLLPEPASAQVNTGIEQFGEQTVLGGDDIRVIVARIIRTFLGLLGVIGVGIVLYGGFLWMTAKGEADKLETAKKVLANGVIGLTIVLASFGIAQFVLNKLVEATGSGAAQTAGGGGGGGGPPGGLHGGCVDPGGTDPYICSISPTEGPVGAYVTLRGYRFGAYDNGTSVVKFGTTAAAVVACGGAPNWKDNLAVVEVPELDPAAYPVSLTNKDGRTATFSSGLASGFTVTTAPLGPQIACIVPDTGPEATGVRIEGKRFGDPNPVLPPPAVVPAQNPITTSVRPLLAVRGQYVTITGTGFGSSSGRVWLGRYQGTVTRLLQAFGPTACGASWWRDDHVVVSVPMVAPITSYDRGFRVAPPDPTNPGVTLPSNYYPDLALSPFQVVAGSAPPGVCEATGDGRTLTVTGEGFGAVTGMVLLDGAPLTVTTWTDRTVTAALPPGARSGASVSLWRAGVSVSDATKASNPMPIVVVPRCLSDGTNCGTVQFTGGPEGGTSATTTAWSDTAISASVPGGAITGDANVIVDAVSSNGSPFRVTCASGAQCSLSNCCIANACFEAAACAAAPGGGGGGGGAGDPCTTDADCSGGLVCDPTTKTCTVPLSGVLSGPVIIDVSPAHRTKADASLERCALATDTGCAPNGAVGNLLTIRGSNFGSEPGSVTLAGVAAAAPAACSAVDTWMDTAIVVAVPGGITAAGPIVVTVGGKSDATNDANGSRIADFVLHTVVRPGLCSATDAVPGGTTTAAGIQFGDTEGSAFVGTTPVAGAGVQDWTVTSADVVVPVTVAAQQTTLAIASASGEQSNAVPLTIGTVAAPPTISSIDPLTGGLGSTITINGDNFGDTIGKVRFRYFVSDTPHIYWLNPTVPAQCTKADWWRDQQITLRIPDVLTEWRTDGGAAQPITAASDLRRSDWKVGVCTGSGVCSLPYVNPFSVTADAPAPGICAIAPTQGPVGALDSRTEVTITGEGFGGTKGAVRFGTTTVLPTASGVLPGELRYWSDTIVRTFIPWTVPPLSGAQAVRLWHDGDDPSVVEDPATPAHENRGSNTVTFTVADCRTDAVICTGATSLCCPANGTCVATASQCAAPINTGAYQWTFSTGEAPRIPTIVKSCDAPSPAPWDGFTDEAPNSTPACVNAKVRIEFSSAMAFADAEGAKQGIAMYACDGSGQNACAALTVVDLNAQLVQVASTRTDTVPNVITIAPEGGEWLPGKRYQVVVFGTTGGGGTALRSAPDPSNIQYDLDGDTDGVPGGNFRFEFVTGTEACAPDRVVVSPAAATLTQPWEEGDTIAGHHGIAHLAAEVSSSSHRCQTLDERSVGSWGWTSDQRRVTVAASGNRWCTTDSDCGAQSCSANGDCPSGVSCAAGQCDFCNAASQCVGFPWTTTAVASGDETPVVGPPATVEATATTGGQQAKDDSPISVRFVHPTIGTTYPARACRVACTNTRIAALVLPASVPLNDDTMTLLNDINAASGTVGLFSCGDETCRRSVLTPVGGVGVAFCSAGSNTSGLCIGRVGEAQQIVVDSPNLQPNTSYRVVMDDGITNTYGVPLGGLSFDRDGTGGDDSFSWTFRTGTGPCAITRITLAPEEVVFGAIGERQSLAATPWSAPDTCTPEGQPVDPGDGVAFGWDIANAGIAQFVSVLTTATGGFTVPANDGKQLLKTTVIAGTSCSTQCLLPGSRRANGICGNGVLEAPAEECESQRSCIGGVRPGAICTTDADCPQRDGISVARSAGTCTGGTFPSWCDSTRCLLKGTTAPTCGNGTIDAGEECDKRDADNVQISTFPSWCDPLTCLNKGSLTCKNGTLEPGEDCDSGAGCSAQCLAEGTPAIPARCGDGIQGTGEECDLGNAPPTQWREQECDYNRCLLTGTYAKPGPSFWYRNAAGNPTPSVCGDGAVHAGESCDLGITSGYADPVQILEAVQTPGAQAETEATVSVTGATSASAKVRMLGVGGACGYENDAEWLTACSASQNTNLMCVSNKNGDGSDFDIDNDGSVIDDYGITADGCGAVRPTIIAQYPASEAQSVCPNALVTVRFDALMDPQSFEAITVEGGTKDYSASLIECLIGTTCTTTEDFGNTARFRFLETTPRLVAVNQVVNGKTVTVHEAQFALTEPLKPNTMYHVYIAGTAPELRPVRSADGVAFSGGIGYAQWRFTTASSLCALDEVRVVPPSALLQRREDTTTLRVTGYSGGVPITSTNAYAWQYAWTSSQSDIATVARDGNTTGATCGTPERCASGSCVAGTCVGPDQLANVTPTAQASGRAIATATATVDVPPGSSATGDDGKRVSSSAAVTVMYCEHPWPDPRGRMWSPHVIAGEDIAFSYCRDSGTEKVCRSTSAMQDPDGATVCTSDVDCAGVTSTRCLPRLNDDLPVPANMTTPLVSVTPAAQPSSPRELRKEFFLLPRNATSTTPASYCSGSGERCDNLPTGFCPPGEFCKPADDAIGIRLYENEEHVAAAQWYADEEFTDAATPVTVDGYRGVQAGRSTYINYANTGSLITNLAVLSYNDDATAETRTIVQRMLESLALTTDLEAGNSRVCSGDATVSCTSNLDCAAQEPSAGTCNAPGDKIRRDVQRVEDLALLQRAISSVTEGRQRCSVTERSCGTDTDCPSGEVCVALPPALASGTFLSGMTTSMWPSWQQELGRELGITLPTDPLNAFGGQCVADVTQNNAYEQTTCWNATGAQYTCPVGSHVYQYRRAGDVAYLGVEFEYTRAADWQPELPTTGLVRVEETICDPTTSSTRAAVCGDGLVQSPETCEPGITLQEQRTCTTSDTPGRSGFQTRSCTSSCAWSTYSTCTALCGNGAVDAGEQCDVGPAGGRVPTRGGRVPGVTGSTEYACTAQCTWTGGRCGNNAVESGYGERCDGTDGTANGGTGPTQQQRTASSEFRQYGCSNQCQPDDGYCGDGIVQNGTGGTVNKEEMCEGDVPDSCVIGDGELAGSELIGGQIKYIGADFTYGTADDSPFTIDSTHNVVFSPDPTAAFLGWNMSVQYPITIKDAGDVLLTVETANAWQDMSTTTVEEIDAATSRAVEYFHPNEASGPLGIYHRIRIFHDTASGTHEEKGVLWALATKYTDPHQVNSVLLRNLPSGINHLSFVFDNDLASSTLNANLVIFKIAFASTRTHQCGDPGSASACTFTGYTACTATPTCGNGTVDTDKGEQCDDSRADGAFAGRCSNDPKKQCYRKPDGSPEGCADGGTCEPNADACTTSCRANMCGDASRLVVQSCIAGPTIGKTCRTNTDCGTGGLCAQEACDLGVVGNWTPAPCNASLASCLENATCTYGRTCNYCTTQCTVVTKQGGFCGDGVQNGSEVCDDGTGTACNDTCTGP